MYKDQVLCPEDSSWYITVYSDTLRSRVAGNIQRLFPDAGEFRPVAEFGSGDVLGLRRDGLAVLLHDSGEVLPSEVTCDELVRLIETMHPDLEKRIYGDQW